MVLTELMAGESPAAENRLRSNRATIYEGPLVDGLKHYQSRHGENPTSKLDARPSMNSTHAEGERLPQPETISASPKRLRNSSKLDPENTTAYADRGLARLETGNDWGAIFDFGDAIRRENRDALADYSKAIELSFGQLTILLSLKQIRVCTPSMTNAHSFLESPAPAAVAPRPLAIGRAGRATSENLSA